MNTEQQFLEAIRASPDDFAAQLVFADLIRRPVGPRRVEWGKVLSTREQLRTL
jgi:hypothetical protein